MLSTFFHILDTKPFFSPLNWKYEFKLFIYKVIFEVLLKKKIKNDGNVR